MASSEQYLKKIYYDSSNPASFAGPDELYRFARKDGKFVLSKYKIKKWLQRQEPYSLQRPIKRPVKRKSCCDWHRRPMGCRFNGWQNVQNIIVDIALYWWQSISSPNTYGCDHWRTREANL